MASSNNMYRVGDFVYVDQGPHVPYGVRRIDELQKSQSGNVEMEVMIYLRRMDVNKEVLPVADENLKGENWGNQEVAGINLFISQSSGMRCPKSIQHK